MSARLAAAVVRLRWVVLAAWVVAAAMSVTLLPTVREAQSGAVGDLVPVDADAIAAEERSAARFAFPAISRTQVVLRDPKDSIPR